jgi:hypothetical protein
LNKNRRIPISKSGRTIREDAEYAELEEPEQQAEKIAKGGCSEY